MNHQPPALRRRARSLNLKPLDFDRSFIDVLISVFSALPGDLCISAVKIGWERLTAETASTQRGRRELQLRSLTLIGYCQI